MIWFWISAVVFIAWFIAWVLGASDPMIWGLTILWIVTLNIGAMRHKYPPRRIEGPRPKLKRQRREPQQRRAA